MANKLYKKLIKQYSEDGGITWYDVVPESFKIGDLLEDPSNCKTEDQKNCRWVIYPIEESYLCEGGNKYYKEYEECTEDGITWVKSGLEKKGTLYKENDATCPQGGGSDDEIHFKYNKGNNYFINTHPFATAQDKPNEYLNTLKGIKINKIVSCKNMFKDVGLTELISLPSTSKVSNMSNMFDTSECVSYDFKSLTNFDTSNVLNMDYMFAGNTKLINLMINDWDTKKVYTTQNMFMNCINLNALSINWVDFTPMNLSQMFEGCSSLTSLNIKNWGNTNNVVCYRMFAGCKTLKEVLLSGNKMNITNITSMFEGCENLQEVDLNGFNTKSANGFSLMFTGCKSLKNIKNIVFDCTSAYTLSQMFDGCSSLSSLDLSKWSNIRPEQMNMMFRGCSSLTTLRLPYIDFSIIQLMASMFSGCSSLTNVDFVNNWNVAPNADCNGIFKGCSSLTNVDLSKWKIDTTDTTGASSIFEDCTSLEKANISGWRVRDITDAFKNCTNLKEINLDNCLIQKYYTNNNGALENCTSLKTIYARGCSPETIEVINYHLQALPQGQVTIVR